MTFSWSERDEWRWLTTAAVGAVGAAVALALFGLTAIDIHAPCTTPALWTRYAV